MSIVAFGIPPLSLPIDRSALVLAIASGVDYLIGDPHSFPHPVQFIGLFIQRSTRSILRQFRTPARQRDAGIALGLFVVLLSAIVSWLMVEAAKILHPMLGLLVEIVMLASCFAGRSLRYAANDVLDPLAEGNLVKARSRLSRYVGRDTENLTEPEILRAVLETVTENATDGVMAPLFYAVVGALLTLGPVPLAIAYKAASTLDSMVGYKTPPYTHLGWFSARMEDALTWPPCRLTVLTIGLLTRKTQFVWDMCLRDATKDPSPNAGWSECAFAAVLGVQLGGANSYRGVVTHKPLLGDPINPISVTHIRKALTLTRYSFLLWLGLSVVILSLIALITFLIQQYAA